MTITTTGAGHQTRAIIYTRFSPRPDAADSDSCEVQRKLCEEFAIKKGWHIVADFADRNTSGASKIDERTGLIAAIDMLKKGDILLALKRDRIARDLLIGLQIERVVENRGASIIVVQGENFGSDPNSIMLKQMLLVLGEWERKMIGERTSIALRAKQKAGIIISAKLPYGYKEDLQNPGRMIEDEAEQAICRQIMECRQRGMSYWAITKILPPESSRVGHWSMEVIRRIYLRMLRDGA